MIVRLFDFGLPMNKIIEIRKFIRLVGKYPQLYDFRHEVYGDYHTRDAIWGRIGREMGVKGEVCKAKWNILRSGYRRALRHREAIPNCRKWRFEEELSFLKDHVKERRRDPGTDNFRNNEEEIKIVKGVDSTSDNEHGEWTNFYNSNAALVAEMVQQVPQCEYISDGLRQFFLSMAETVKMLPPLVQAKIKAEVFRCVNSAEIAYFAQHS